MEDDEFVIARSNSTWIRMMFPPGKLVAVSDDLHDMFRKGGVVKEINEEGKVVVFFVDSGDEIAFRPNQLMED